MTKFRWFLTALAVALSVMSFAVAPAYAAPAVPSVGASGQVGYPAPPGAGGGGATANPSVSLAAPSSCASTQLCLYVDSGYNTGGGYMLWPARSAGVCEVVDPYRNALSSAWNSSGRDVRFYKNTSCTGTDFKTLYNGTGNPQLSTHWGLTWNDSVDAIQWRP